MAIFKKSNRSFSFCRSDERRGDGCFWSRPYLIARIWISILVVTRQILPPVRRDYLLRIGLIQQGIDCNSDRQSALSSRPIENGEGYPEAIDGRSFGHMLPLGQKATRDAQRIRLAAKDTQQHAEDTDGPKTSWT